MKTKLVPGVLRGVGIFLVAVMVFWLATTNTAPNHVVNRIILGFVMIGIAYLIEIKDLLVDLNQYDDPPSEP